jgi:hypothetical protein
LENLVIALELGLGAHLLLVEALELEQQRSQRVA